MIRIRRARETYPPPRPSSRSPRKKVSLEEMKKIVDASIFGIDESRSEEKIRMFYLVVTQKGENEYERNERISQEID